MASTIFLPEICGENNSFWDPGLTLNTDTPDLTECFQQTVLIWTPCFLFWIMFFPYLFHLVYKDTVVRSTSPLYVAKLICSILLCCIALLNFVKVIVEELNDSPPIYFYISPAVQLVSFIMATVTIKLEFKKGLHTSGVLIVFWLSLVFTGLFSAISNIELAQRTYGHLPDLFRYVTFYINYGLVVFQFVLSLQVDLPREPKYRDSGEKEPLLTEHRKHAYNGHIPVDSAGNGKEWPVCQEAEVSFLSKITFWWITRLLIQGYKNVLRFEEYTDIMPTEKCRKCIQIFDKVWKEVSVSVQKFVNKERAELIIKERELEKERTKAKENGKKTKEDKKEKEEKVKGPDPSGYAIFKALVISNSGILLVGATIKLVWVFWQFMNPMLLDVVIGWVSSDDPYVWKGYTLAVVLLVVNIITALIVHNYFKAAQITGMRCRSIVTASVYAKALRLSNSARTGSTVGQIVNLMSVDAQKVHDICANIHEIWSAPLSIGVAIYMLWQEMGIATLGGIAVLILLAPVNGGYIVRQIGKLQIAQMIQKDKRIKKLNEILSGIKVIKMYAWEIPFGKLVGDIRMKELKTLQKAAYIYTFVGVTWFSAPYLVSLAVFATYILSSSDNYLTPQKAFVSINLINVLNFAMSFLPVILAFASQTYVSLKRLVKFLTEEELDPALLIRDRNAKNAISVENGTFTWGSSDDNPVLTDINIEVTDRELLAIVGQVGCGKSSLISTMLGETRKLQGQVTLKGRTAYVAQQAWIQNATLKDNILFGKPMDQRKYESVLEACALKPDLEILPGGDMTEIGEKGINLSGGQKQRVSLARAVYQNEDIYLLDDPLSAVDAHVGKHIFEHVIGPKGLLRNKTRVLVTHGVTYLPHVDRIVCMKQGKISEMGTYKELVDKEEAFAEFVKTYLMDSGENGSESSDNAPVLERQISAFDYSGSTSQSEVQYGSPRRRRSRRASSRKISSEPIKEESTNGTTSGKTIQGKDQLVEEEAAGIGSISFAVIKAYAKAGGLVALLSLILSQLLYTAAQSGTNIWLSMWSDDPVSNGTEARDQSLFRLEFYAVFGAFQIIGIFGCSLSVFLGCVYASKILHRDLLASILKAPMSFFDTTPVGRIVNRFSTDMDKLDSTMPSWTRQLALMTSNMISTIVIISYSTPIFLVVVVPLMILYYIIQKIYITTVRQMKRIDSIHRSPIYTNFDETLVGVPTIRAFQQEARFISKNERLVDESQICWYPILISQRWLGFWLDSVGALVVFFACLFAVIERDSITGGLVGLSISYSMQTTYAVNMMVRCATEIETTMVSAERIHEYTNVPTEAQWIIEEKRPPISWPQNGEVEFKDYSTRYRPGLDLVLRDVSFSIKAKEKIGIVGRTGAGKSSMTLAMYRIIEAAAGSIRIDGLSISDIGLHDLRSKLTIIPQDPMLFSGTLRDNLDPFETEEDDKLWQTLEHAHLKDFVSRLKEGLDYECGEGGSSLSVGQRQLVCLARALLKKSKILILDEATAAVDLETDDLIQHTIRTEFSDCTVLTIAHRLNTILDYDKVMVLDNGKIAEFAPPDQLLKDSSSKFYSMAQDAGIV